MTPVRSAAAALLLLTSVAGAAEPVTTQKVSSRVPAWDARGLGLLPLQGVACLDVSDDGSRIVVGTIALPGDFNVHVLDADGSVLRSAKVGQRWIGQVAAAPGDQAFALCTMVSGSAFDEPLTYLLGDPARPVTGGEGGMSLFHYGDHSNHTGKQVLGYRDGAVTLTENQILWLKTAGDTSPEKAATPAARSTFRNLKATSAAVHSSGVTLVGGYADGGAPGQPTNNLFVFAPGGATPLWSRSVVREVGPSDAPEAGEYGTPRLPDGSRNPLPQRDDAVFAPLSLAVTRDAEFSPASRVASVDYRGWQRTIRSSATLKDEVYGVRFQPAKPTVTVYDGAGKVLRRFGPEKFAQAGWVDVEFLPGGEKLLATPHRWACRGLAGQTFLPSDDHASTLSVLDVATGEVRSRTFPDAIADAAVAKDGAVVVSCWNGRVYRLSSASLVDGALPAGTDVGRPAIVGFGAEGRIVAATGAGEIVLLSAAGEVQKRIDLNAVIPRPEKPWVKHANATPLAKGLWQNPGGRVESDLGGQTVIEAPDGLILIDPHAGLSFESEWRAMEVAGLDPKRVKYVLGTHEHGDHSPGASLWRVATGAQFVCSRQMAYTLQHHLPQGTGYGLHAPVKADVVIDEDTTLDLAGLKVGALRLPGHTFGAMGWAFERDGQRFVSIGDLIMPEGRLGYSGSVNFSPYDVLESLRRLDDLKVDKVLPGHGPVVGPDKYFKAGIAVGTRVGWGKMTPEKPDPRFAIGQPNVLVTGFLAQATSAAFGDVDGDGLPDVALVTPHAGGSLVKVFLNHPDRVERFDSMKADFEVAAPSVATPTKVRVTSLNDDKRMDLFVSGQGTVATLKSREKLGEYDTQTSTSSEVHQLRTVDVDGSGRRESVMLGRFSAAQLMAFGKENQSVYKLLTPAMKAPYLDLREVDLNGDGRSDWLANDGRVWQRGANGRFEEKPSYELPLPAERDWHYCGAGDFNGDRKPDVVLGSFGMQGKRIVHVFHNTGNAEAPFTADPSVRFEIKAAHPHIRDAALGLPL